MALINVDNLSHSYQARGFGSVPALRGVSLAIEPGEYVAIVGANGSGKTTLALHLNALLRPSAGRVVVDGLDTADQDQARRIRRVVAMIFQSPLDQIVATVAEEDVAFGPENLGIPQAELPALVRRCLERVGLWEQRLRPPHLLSAGQQQRLAIAGALAVGPRCLILDEATSMLDPAGAALLLDLIDELNRDGMTIVTVTHKMDEAGRARRLVVLAAGAVADDGPPRRVLARPDLDRWGLEPPFAARLRAALASCLPQPLSDDGDLAASVARQVGRGRGQGPLVAAARPPGSGKAVEIRGLDHVYLRGSPLEQVALSGVDFDLPDGATGILIGSTGSGKSTLLQHLNGLLSPQKGSVHVLGQDTGTTEGARLVELRRRVGLVFQRPEQQLFERYVGDEIAFGPRQAGSSGADLRERVRWAMERVGLDFEAFKDRPVFALSGGERRRVGLAGVLALRPSLLALDEPTTSLDPAGRRRILGLLAELRGQGTQLVATTHSMEEAAELGDRLLVLDRGRSVASGDAAAVFADRRRLASWGLSLPPALAFVEELQALGVELGAAARSGRLRDLTAAVAAVARGEGRP